MMFRAPWRAAAVGGVSGTMLAALVLEERVRRVTHERRDAYVRRWAGSLLKLLGVEVEMCGAPLATGERRAPLLVVANHRSTLDILLLLHLFGGHFLARGDMATWPAIGLLARRAGTVFVDRSDPTSGAAAVRRMRERLKRGVTMCVFPEGTTFEGDEVRPFHAGAFIAVAHEKGTVLPVGLAYANEDAIYKDEPVIDHMKRLARMPRIRVGVALGLPIAAPESSSRVLAALARTKVQELVHQARLHVGHRS